MVHHYGICRFGQRNEVMLSKSNPTQIESPCVRNCCLNDQDICVGCYRSLDEILRWSKVSEEERSKILKNTDRRKAQLSSVRLNS
ncbi:DUF1289 domain-containing protein [Neptuniibacter sp. PT34_22]|uniref:DUF1289 domain-containing protein n=1 Tax=Neptuniibacter sp. PT34_22 TaxID=3398205 RepID=UPI0039F5C52A